jgi:hyperosmotically inducible periplasmic protein
MLISFKKNILLPGTTFLLLTASTISFATPTQDIIDARQETQIWTTYALSPYLRASELKVSVKDGKATLSGMVEEDVNSDLAKQIALGVSGIEDVDNQIQVKADYKPVASEGKYGDVIDDVSISAVIKSKLLWSKSTDSNTIDVKTAKGKVVLTGNAMTDEAKEMAGRLASGTQGVVSVTNNILVNKTPGKSGTARASTYEVGNNISDTWITTKVISMFLYSRNVAGSDINVTTNAGVVTLSGKLDSGVERALAIELAQNIRGVKSVQAKELVN